MPTNLYFVRHGRSYSNLEKCYYDDSEESLIAEGRMQAWNAGYQLKKTGVKFDSIYCSPYVRAKETCQIALHEMGLGNCTVWHDSRLRERDFLGVYGKPFSRELNRELYDYTSEYSEKHGVETLERLENRARSFMNNIKSRHPNGNVLVFSHGVLGLAFRAVAEGRPKSGNLCDLGMLKFGEIMKLVLE